MKREILFRGKRKDTGEWVEGFYFSMYHSAYIRVVDYIAPTFNQPDLSGEEINDYEVVPETVGQYTGFLATIQGGLPSTEKIFEGDVVEIDSAFIGFDIDPDFKGVIKFMENGWYVDNGTEAFDLWSEVWSWAIIGNIHDNPELLNQPSGANQQQ